MIPRAAILLATGALMLGCAGVASSPQAVPTPAPVPVITKPSPSFDCQKATTATEKLICASATVSALDRRLAAAWGPAVTRAADPAALRGKEKEWLAGNATCSDEACLSERYLERIGYLNGVAAAEESAPSSVTGHYQSDRSQVAVLESPVGMMQFGLFATGGGSPEGGPNLGTASGTVRLVDGVGTWTLNDYGGCALTFHFKGQQMELAQNGSDGSCGFGMGVYADGTYTRSDHRAPSAEELSNGF